MKRTGLSGVWSLIVSGCQRAGAAALLLITIGGGAVRAIDVLTLRTDMVREDTGEGWAGCGRSPSKSVLLNGVGQQYREISADAAYMQDPECIVPDHGCGVADLNNDGALKIIDVSALLTALSAGCP